MRTTFSHPKPDGSSQGNKLMHTRPRGSEENLLYKVHVFK